MSKNRFIVAGSFTPAEVLKLNAAVAGIKAGAVIINVTFKKSLGNLRAHQGRNGAIIKSGTITAVGHGVIVLADGQAGDTIGIAGETEGTAVVTINVEATPAVPETYGPGAFDDIFIIK